MTFFEGNGSPVKGVLAKFLWGCPQMEPIHFQGGMFSPGKLGEVPCLKDCVSVSPVSTFNPSPPPGSAPVLQWMRGVQMDRLLLSLARLTLKSTESLWICT